MSSMLEPPSYDHSESTTRRRPVKSNELMILELQKDQIIALNTNQVLFELSQAPQDGLGSALAVERITYSTRMSNSEEPQIRPKKHHIYSVKKVIFTNHTMKPRNTLLLEAEAGPRSCIKGPSAIVKGVPFPLLPVINYGESWHIGTLGPEWAYLSSFKTKGGREYRDGSGTVVAISGENEVQLETKVPVDEKMLNALVTLWCGSMWNEYRKLRRKQNGKEYSKFAPNYSKTKSPRPIRLYGSNIPVAMQ